MQVFVSLITALSLLKLSIQARRLIRFFLTNLLKLQLKIPSSGIASWLQATQSMCLLTVVPPPLRLLLVHEKLMGSELRITVTRY